MPTNMESSDEGLGPEFEPIGTLACGIPKGRIVPMLGVVISLLTSAAALGADTVYQCTPSGFSLSVAPIRGSSLAQFEFDVTVSVPYASMQEMIAERLFRTSLFSRVSSSPSGPHPDSSDLSLLLSIPIARETVGRAYPAYELTVSVMLVENVGGYALLSETYASEFQSTYSKRLPQLERSRTEILIGFAAIIPQIVEDLERALNQNLEPEYAAWKESRTVVHSHLERLWIAPTRISGSSPGLQNYGRYVAEKLRDRLARKNCFIFPPLTDALRDCLAGVETVDRAAAIKALNRCPTVSSLDGMLLLITLTAESEGRNLHALLVLLPSAVVLYDRTVSISGGWHLGNRLEEHAAGIAQASHVISH